MGELADRHFEPPLQGQLTPSSINFLAPAPVQAYDETERSQFDALNQDFGPAVGTFASDNRLFAYSVIHHSRANPYMHLHLCILQ